MVLRWVFLNYYLSNDQISRQIKRPDCGAGTLLLTTPVQVLAAVPSEAGGGVASLSASALHLISVFPGPSYMNDLKGITCYFNYLLLINRC